MLTVNHYAHIRQLHRDGLTIRQIAQQLHHSPKTILKALQNPGVYPTNRVGAWARSHAVGKRGETPS